MLLWLLCYFSSLVVLDGRFVSPQMYVVRMVIIPATQAEARPSMPLNTDSPAKADSISPAIMLIKYLFESFIAVELH